MDYTKYANKAYSKLDKYGSAIKIKRSGNKIYDKTTNTYTDGGEEFSGVAIQRSFSIKDIDGTNVKYGDALFMAQLPKRPVTNDTVNFGGRNYTVLNADPMNVDGSVDIFVMIHAR
ncbi:hypothetical protein SAMN04487977_101468 [Treponema bryantii]|uniref:Uncharacterized protein n=1 Tax=Treponema bryantii TaxID=163 RepID=A0A1H9AUS4_9SPIR|nr:hypothetical protein [Treponema bryantii]SEP80163.1 hypothetical protein SAMN04487977_101468 [Treponema bryantii]